MKIEKKLKRGLAELSDFFAPQSSCLTIAPPEISCEDPCLKPSLTTAGLYSFSPSFHSREMVDCMQSARPLFQDIRFVTLGDKSPITQAQLKSLLRPQIRSQNLESKSSTEKTLLVFSSDSWADDSDHSAIEFLDHAIFVSHPDTKQLMRIYQFMQIALSKNPSMNCSLLLAGEGAERLCELIYGRFSEMISQFLGHDLGFLGWTENHQVCANFDFLKEESDNIFVRYAKKHLSYWI